LSGKRIERAEIGAPGEFETMTHEELERCADRAYGATWPYGNSDMTDNLRKWMVFRGGVDSVRRKATIPAIASTSARADRTPGSVEGRKSSRPLRMPSRTSSTSWEVSSPFADREPVCCGHVGCHKVNASLFQAEQEVCITRQAIDLGDDELRPV
jgi:hypothetical protein